MDRPWRFIVGPWRVNRRSMMVAWKVHRGPLYVDAQLMNSLDGPLRSIVVHGYFMVVHGPSIDILRWFHGQFHRQSMDHHELSMDRHRPPWTVHGLFMRCPCTRRGPRWTVHGTTMDFLPTRHGPPWTVNGTTTNRPWNVHGTVHGAAMDCIGTTTDAISMERPWTVRVGFMDDPCQFMVGPWRVHGKSTLVPWTAHRGSQWVLGQSMNSP